MRRKVVKLTDRQAVCLRALYVHAATGNPWAYQRQFDRRAVARLVALGMVATRVDVTGDWLRINDAGKLLARRLFGAVDRDGRVTPDASQGVR